MRIKEKIAAAVDRVLQGDRLDQVHAVELIETRGADLWDLFAGANRIREHYHGNAIHACSIVNARSGACSEDCAYCAQSVHHQADAPVYPLLALEDMVKAAESAKMNGARRFCIVTSGRGVGSPDDLANIAAGVRRIKELGISPCATLGTLTGSELAILKEAGLERYHHNIETSREYFPSICTTHSFEERLSMVRQAQALGLSTCSGGILGMGESMKDRVNMAFTLRELQVDSVPINFLMPIKGTPLERSPAIRPLEALHALALFRLILPEREIRVCAGRGTSLGELHPFIFTAGANGFMIGNYLTRSGLDPQKDRAIIHDLGLTM